MGPNELNELRRQAEQGINSANSAYSHEVRAAVAQARATLYLAEVIRDGIGELSAVLGSPHAAAMPSPLLVGFPICTDAGCQDRRPHEAHVGEEIFDFTAAAADTESSDIA